MMWQGLCLLLLVPAPIPVLVAAAGRQSSSSSSTAAHSVSLGFFRGSELRLENVRDPNVRELPLPDHVKGHILAFEYGTTTPSTKLAAYDFDGTLASPHACMGTYCPGSWEGSGPPVVPGGSVWEGYREWRHTFPNEMRKVLRNDSATGYKVVIISNQSPLVEPTVGERSLLFGRDVASRTPEEKQLLWAEKLIEFCQTINSGKLGEPPAVPMQVFAMLTTNPEEYLYKPCPGWWALQTEHLNGDVTQIDCAESFYCGDSGGRLRGCTTNPWSPVPGSDQWTPGVFAAGDRQFALSAGVPFVTPETAFLGWAPPLDPEDYDSDSFSGEWCGKGGPTPWCLPVSAAQGSE